MEIMIEENLYLEGLVKDLASMMKNLQEEISGLKKDKEGVASAPQPKNKCPHDDEDVATQNLTLKLNALVMASPVRTKVCQAMLRAIPPECTQYQPRAKPSWRPPSASSLIMQRGVNK